MRHQIILFIEPAKEEWKCPESIGNLYLNRFAIDEDAAHEVLGVYYLQQSSAQLCDPKNKAYKNNAIERQEKIRFDNKIFQKGIQLAAQNQSSSVQNHIFATGPLSLLDEKTSNCMEYISNLIQHYKIGAIVLTQLLLHRIRVCSLESVKPAYKDDQGIILDTKPDLSRMTKVEISKVSFWPSALVLKSIPEILRRWYKCDDWKPISTAYPDLCN